MVLQKNEAKTVVYGARSEVVKDGDMAEWNLRKTKKIYCKDANKVRKVENAKEAGKR